jgi:hypothetical protein
MENDITESQSRNAAKVATFAAAIALIGVASAKVVRYGKAKLAGRETTVAPAHTAE